MSVQKLPCQPVVGEPVVSVAPTGTQTGVNITGSDKKKRRPNLPPEFRKRLNSSSEPAKNLPIPPRGEHLPPSTSGK